jgi:Cu-Zn family superoxide dismutase
VKRAIVLAAALAAALLAVAGAGADSKPTAYTLPGNAVFPEGVAFEQRTGSFFATSTTDGTIFRGDVKKPAASVFLPGGADGRTTAIGLESDPRGLLWVAGGNTGRIFSYRTKTGALDGKFETGSGGFLNDVAVTRNGDAFVTDSVRPTLWRVARGATTAEAWLDFTGTPIRYVTGFNLNGIVATEDGRYLIVAQTNTSSLFRIDTRTKQIVQIAGASVAGDGLQLRGRTLWAIAGGAIVKVKLSGDLTQGRVVSTTTDPSFDSPTTNAIARGRMLVVNSQFAARNAGTAPRLPFTISSVRVP